MSYQTFPTPYKRKALVAYYKQFNLTATEMNKVDMMFRDAALFMKVCGLILLLIGVPSNLMVLHILRGKKMRRSLTALFLVYLAMFNLVNILLGLTRYVVVSFGGPDIRLYSETMCILHSNLVQFGHLGANWSILAVGVCKMAYVLVPDTLMKNLPPSFAHSVMITVCVYGYSFTTIFSEQKKEWDLDTKFGLTRCDPEYLTFSALAQMSITFFVPEIAMLVVNITTVKAYYRIWTNATLQDKKTVRVNYIMGIMLFASDVQLMVAEVPYIIINTFKPLIVTYTPMGAATYTLASYMATCALYSNYALNCLTVCFFGGVFRRELRRQFRPVLKHIFDPRSRWVSSDTSLIIEEVKKRTLSATANRLSLTRIFETDTDDDEVDRLSLVKAQNAYSRSNSNLFGTSSKSGSSSEKSIGIKKRQSHERRPEQVHPTLWEESELFSSTQVTDSTNIG